MASMLMPRCPLIKPHFHYRPATNTLRNTVFLRTTLRMESSAAADAAADSASTAQDTESDTVVQYVVLRRDLINTWPLGSVVTQGCHASVAAIWAHKDDPHTLSYCSPPNLDSMHKVTLEVKGETQLLNLSEKLKAGGIAHKLWIEQPENFSTCLATKPYPKSTVSSFFKKLKLLQVVLLLNDQRTSKNPKQKRKQSEDASILAKSFNESTEKLRETLSFSQAQRELALQLEKEKQQLEKEKQQLERERLEVIKKGQEMKQLKREDKILAMDTDAISDPERRNYFRNVQQQILQKRTEEEQSTSTTFNVFGMNFDDLGGSGGGLSGY